MVTIEEAQQIILRHTTAITTERRPLLLLQGRVLAEDISALWDIPPADNSAMDGYAFACDPWSGELLRIDGFLPAGQQRVAPVVIGKAVRIMTGAPIPAGCDAVVPFEDVEETDGRFRLKNKVSVGANIRRRGEDIGAGDLAFPAGSRLRPQEIGMLAAMGMDSALVYRPARVAILATGNELLEIGEEPVPGKILNSNSYSIASQVIDAGGEPLLLGIARDNKESTRDLIKAGLSADLLITTGGVSAGDLDCVKEVLTELGGKIKFWQVAIKPGKPLAFAMVNNTQVFALPGNPAAAMVTFEEFVRPAMLKMMGHSRIFRPTKKAVLTAPVRNNGKRPHLARGLVELVDGRHVVAACGNQSSGCLSSLTRGNSLILLPPDTAFVAGDEVEVQLLDQQFEMGEHNDGAY